MNQYLCSRQQVQAVGPSQIQIDKSPMDKMKLHSLSIATKDRFLECYVHIVFISLFSLDAMKK